MFVKCPSVVSFDGLLRILGRLKIGNFDSIAARVFLNNVIGTVHAFRRSVTRVHLIAHEHLGQIVMMALQRKCFAEVLL